MFKKLKRIFSYSFVYLYFIKFQWITQTILTRIIKEIKEVNASMSLHGVANISIGSSGLERLKKAAAMSHVYQNIPSLSSLISFLDISANQEYVVQRINGEENTCSY